MERNAFRKSRQYFETSSRPNHVTFDDGKSHRRNLPWIHYVEARWDYSEPDSIKVFIGDWVMVITGHHLGPVFAAFEEQTLLRIRAQPDLERDAAHDDDSFATEIRFMKARESNARKAGQTELELGLG